MQAFHFDVVDSTNERAKRILQSGEIRGPAYVLAREQTHGKGSRGREWLSPRDAGIYLSIVDVREPPPLCSDVILTDFTLAAGVACAEAIAGTVGVDVKLKPINDLFVRGRKVGGILTEAVIEQDRARAIVIGVGINLHEADRPLPEGQPAAISLAEAACRLIPSADVHRLTDTVIRNVRKWSAMVWAGECETVQTAWNKHRTGTGVGINH